jgi:two-component system, chemotaxis family, sensor kinase CheA
MVDRARLLERLMATFVDELDEHVQTLSDGVLTLEKGLSGDEHTECLTVMFRAAHSLKGASRAVDQEAVERLCHVLEDAYGAIRDGALQPEPGLCSLLLATTDMIGTAGQAMRAKQPVDDAAIDSLRQQLQAAVAGESFTVPGRDVAGSGEQNAGAAAATVPEPASPSALESVPRSEPQSVPQPRPESDGPAATDAQPAPKAAHVGDPETPDCSAAPESGAAPSRTRVSSTVRVAQEKLDTLLAQTGELLVARQRIDAHPEAVEGLLDTVADWKHEWQGVQRALTQLVENTEADPLLARSPQFAAKLVLAIESNGEQLRDLERSLERLRRQTQADARQLNTVGGSVQDQVHDIRMVPFEEACAGLERAVRDIATTTGKHVELGLEGGDIEVDRSVITGLADPLMHLVRNAIDHGIELSAERSACGKSEVAQVTVSASLRGSQVQVVVADDGRGLSLDKIREKIRKRGLPEPADEQELVNSIFLPGFSTADIITDVSGRGVGMDVVKSQVENLRGSIEISTQAGFGTRFTLLVPLTLTTINAVFVTLGRQEFLLPSSNVRKLVSFQPSELRQIQGQQMLRLGESPLPVVSLNELLGRDAAVQPSESGRLTGLVATVGSREAVLAVDSVTSEREIVVKNLGPRLHRVPHVSGATLLQTGEIALLLNVPSLMRALSSGGRSLAVSDATGDAAASVAATRVMVVDDSVTTRTLIRSILESAGYDVEAAVDGQDAWDQMQATQDAYDVVVSDVEMPRMDGFRLTETIRMSDRYHDTPIVLCTSRGTDQDKALGVRAGASAYLIKSEFDQTNILDTIEQLI